MLSAAQAQLSDFPGNALPLLCLRLHTHSTPSTKAPLLSTPILPLPPHSVPSPKRLLPLASPSK